MTSNKLLVYHENEIKTVTDLHINLVKKEEANIALEEQELLLPDGKIAMQTDRPVKRKEDANLVSCFLRLFLDWGRMALGGLREVKSLPIVNFFVNVR